MTTTMGQASLCTFDTLLGQFRLLRPIDKANEGVFLARFSRRKRYVWGAIEHHFVICWLDGWLDWVAGCVRPLIKIWFRFLEVLTKNLVLSVGIQHSGIRCRGVLKSANTPSLQGSVGTRHHICSSSGMLAWEIGASRLMLSPSGGSCRRGLLAGSNLSERQGI